MGHADVGGGPGGKGTPADVKGGPDRKGAGMPVDAGGGPDGKGTLADGRGRTEKGQGAPGCQRGRRTHITLSVLI
jgi:hypothetical protein